MADYLPCCHEFRQINPVVVATCCLTENPRPILSAFGVVARFLSARIPGMRNSQRNTHYLNMQANFHSWENIRPIPHTMVGDKGALSQFRLVHLACTKHQGFWLSVLEIFNSSRFQLDHSSACHEWIVAGVRWLQHYNGCFKHVLLLNMCLPKVWNASILEYDFSLWKTTWRCQKDVL